MGRNRVGQSRAKARLIAAAAALAAVAGLTAGGAGPAVGAAWSAQPVTTPVLAAPAVAVQVAGLESVAVPAATASSAVRPGPKLNGPRATSVLKALKVKGKAAGTGYSRNAKFGNGWQDFDGDKCNERQDTLSRDMSQARFSGTKKCQVASGTLHDRYTGRTIRWRTGTGSVDIDHVVALQNAWISGAQQLSQAQRLKLANDPLNLIAADSSANRAKGSSNAAEWLPKHKAFRCQYVATQISVKRKYALSVTAAEKAAMSRVLASCPSQKAAKVTPIKPAGKVGTSTSGGSTSGTVSGTVSPGAFCKAADKGKNGRSASGVAYTCKASSTENRLRWRR